MPETQDQPALSPAKSRILDAAEDLFANHGFAATSMVDIAEIVGVRGPALYKHYPSKEAVYDAVLERLFEPMQPYLTLPAATEEASLELLPALVQHHIDQPNLARIIQQATLSSDRHLEQLVARWYRPFFADILNTTAADTAVVMAFHSMLLGYLTLAPLHQKIFQLDPLDKQQMAQQLQLQSQLAALLSGSRQNGT